MISFYPKQRDCQQIKPVMSVAHDMTGFVAHHLSGLRWPMLEVADGTDRVATGDPEDAI
jgi:hypothetical protein